MPLATLHPVLAAAEARRATALGLVCLSWEDAVAFVRAGEAAGAPVILSAGPGARRHMPLTIWGMMFRELAVNATVDVVAHLDHGATPDECFAALDAGFTSVMFDGSKLPLDQNIAQTQSVIERAQVYGASTEAEIGFVGYADGAQSAGTDPDDAIAFHAEARTDCLAVSVGNVHLHTEQTAPLDFDLLGQIHKIGCPLVLHGGSGVPLAHRTRAARDFGVRKINLGTEIRQEYGRALRASLAQDADSFDRLKIQAPVTDAIQMVTEAALKQAWEKAP